MTWLPIITLTINGQTRHIPWALMQTAEACAFTGLTVTAGLQVATPGATASWTCAPQVGV